jgi:hypothetical protein
MLAQGGKKKKRSLKYFDFEPLNQNYYHVEIYDTHWRLSARARWSGLLASPPFLAQQISLLHS